MQIAKTQAWFDDFIVSINAPESEEEPGEDQEGESDLDGPEYSKIKVSADGYKVEYDKKA